MKLLTALLTLFSSLQASAGYPSPVIFSGIYARTIPNHVSINDNVYVLTGTADPTSVAQSAPKGSLYLRYGASGGNVYYKTDAGSSTNWSKIGSTGSNTFTGTSTFPGNTVIASDGELTVGEATAAKITLVPVSGSGSEQRITFKNAAASGRYNWVVGNNYNGQYWELTPSTAADGTTFSSPAIKADAANSLITFGMPLANPMTQNARLTVTGTVAVTAGTGVAGSGTAFLDEFRVGDAITINAETKNVVSISSDTVLAVDVSFASTTSGVAATRSTTISNLVSPRGAIQVGGSRTTAVNLNSSDLYMTAVASAVSAGAGNAPSARLRAVTYGGAVAASSAQLVLMKARGTEAGPVVPSSGDTISNISFGGWDGSAFQTGSQINNLTTEAWDASHRGNQIVFTTVPNTSTTRTTALTLDQDQASIFGGALKFTTKIFLSPTAPTISSGFGTSPSVASNNGTAAFTINVGTGGSATSGVIGLPAATTGWNCFCTDVTTNSSTVFMCKQTASSTTTATIGNFNTSAAAAAWVASDIVRVSCFAY